MGGGGGVQRWVGGLGSFFGHQAHTPLGVGLRFLGVLGVVGLFRFTVRNKGPCALAVVHGWMPFVQDSEADWAAL